MPQLFYCNSIYRKTICDLNPLIPVAFRDKKILVIPARQQQVKRIKKTYNNISCIGWWDLQKTGMIDVNLNTTNLMHNYDIIVIIDRDRIDMVHFKKTLTEVEKLPFLKDYLVN
jgi:hypothetical protein